MSSCALEREPVASELVPQAVVVDFGRREGGGELENRALLVVESGFESGAIEEES